METADCPYCRSIPGVGTGEAAVPRTAFDEVLAGGTSFVLTPTIGMIVPGYFLLITRQHLNAFSMLDADVLDETEAWLESTLATLGKEFGEYFVFEHGSAGDPNASGNAGCIVHAHLHLIPMAGVRDEAARRLEVQSFDQLSSLRRFHSSNYALVGTPGSWGVAPEPALPGQWIRRVLADALGPNAQFDWALEYGTDQLADTLQRLPTLAEAP